MTASGGRTTPSGQARLTAWIRARAARDRVVALEEALLGGAFWRFALRRLSVFAFARAWGTALHVVELTFLTEIFVARPFVASLALQNATLVIDAFWWGALEALRRRARAIGVRAQAQVLTTRYMTVAFIAGVAGCCVPLARMAWRWHDGTAPTMLDAYALVCLLRLAIDMVLRTLYSGVYAYGRVHRPAWSAPISSTVLVGLTVASWPWLKGWSFVAALLVSVLCSRALLLRFTLRAYRLARVPLPAWRWRWRRSRARADWRLLGDSALAGVANLTTRLASVVLLGAVLPSLDADDGQLQAVAYVLHLAAPLILVTSQWAFVFYHDWKRLEADVAAVLSRRLHRCLLAVAGGIAALAWGATVILVLAFTDVSSDAAASLSDGSMASVASLAGALARFFAHAFAARPWSPAERALIALGPTYLGLSIWTALQLRGFSRGEFTSQAVSAAIIIGAVAACGAAIIDRDVWLWMLAGCPWIAVGAHALLGRWSGAASATSPATLDGWMLALSRRRDPVVVWRAQLAGPRPGQLAEEVRHALASSRPRAARRAARAAGSALPWRRALYCYEPAPGDGRQAWVVRCAGLLTGFESASAASGGDAASQLVRRGWLIPPAGELNARALERAHARLFPGGFTLHVGRRPPAAFLALEPEVRQAIWRDAIRRVTAGRRRASPASALWRVHALAPGGTLTHVFVAPRRDPPGSPPASGEVSNVHEWAQLLRQTTWRSPVAATVPSTRNLSQKVVRIATRP